MMKIRVEPNTRNTRARESPYLPSSVLIAIEQRLTLTQKLEDLEMNNEQNISRRTINSLSIAS
jgi:hypothetical protein